MSEGHNKFVSNDICVCQEHRKLRPGEVVEEKKVTFISHKMHRAITIFIILLKQWYYLHFSAERRILFAFIMCQLHVFYCCVAQKNLSIITSSLCILKLQLQYRNRLMSELEVY